MPIMPRQSRHVARAACAQVKSSSHDHEATLLEVTLPDESGAINPARPTVGRTSADSANISPKNSRVGGVVMAMVSGVLYGNNFTPPTYLLDHGYGPAQPLDYVFSHFCGIFAGSTFWFVVYCVAKRSAPTLYPKLVLPALLSGVARGDDA